MMRTVPVLPFIFLIPATFGSISRFFCVIGGLGHVFPLIL